MLQFEMSANLRQKFGKGESRKLRRSGKTPAVLYGPAAEPVTLELDTKDLTKALINIQRRNAVVNLEISDGKGSSKRPVIVKEIQADPIKDSLTHADFYEISLEKPITLQVPLRYKGKAKGVDMGGDLVVSRTEVSLRGKILDIPDEIVVDVKNLEPGAGIHCKDLDIPANLTLLDDEEAACVSVTPVSV